MSKVKFEKIEDGRIDTERVAYVMTADGVEEEVTITPNQVEDGYLLLPEVFSDANRVLVELPRESSSGRWRLWISKDKLGAGA